jgi:hypothetical protein
MQLLNVIRDANLVNECRTKWWEDVYAGTLSDLDQSC